jgi:eukaryotic-like serine/threonine-protein kinase
MTEQSAADATGQQVGRYKLLELLGRGTSGVVYRALDTASKKTVALKIIDPEVFEDPEFGAERHSQFLAEASLAGMLIHPHIVSILDAAVEHNSGYIAMELVTAGDLSQHTKPGTLLPVPDVLEIAFNCCSALDYTSRVGIIHCDIKPANIMIAEGTDVRITDFGAAVLRKTNVVRNAAMGSPHYMSPEQIAGKDLTLHSDMYSLGVVLYELLTGRLPFAADDLDELVRKILTANPTPPSRLRPELSAQFDKVVLRALSKKPEQRFRGWADFAHELSEFSRRPPPEQVISQDEKLNALKQVGTLEQLSDGELVEIAMSVHWSRAKAADVILREGEPGSNFFLLAEGSVKVVRRGRLLNLINEGEFFGEIPYVLGRPRQRHATVVATRNLLLGEFMPDALARLSPTTQLQLVRALARNLVDRLMLSNERLTG